MPRPDLRDRSVSPSADDPHLDATRARREWLDAVLRLRARHLAQLLRQAGPPARGRDALSDGHDDCR